MFRCPACSNPRNADTPTPPPIHPSHALASPPPPPPMGGGQPPIPAAPSRPPNIDLRPLALILHADLIPTRDMKHAVHARHRSPHTLLLRHISLVNLHTQILQIARLRRITYHRHYLMPGFHQLARHVSTNKTRRTRHKVFHHSSFGKERQPGHA